MSLCMTHGGRDKRQGSKVNVRIQRITIEEILRVEGTIEGGVARRPKDPCEVGSKSTPWKAT